MNKGNAVFYHKHIQSNITKLDQRKDKFISHRLQFLRQFCQPIKQKIGLVQKQIQRYKIMRDTQEQVIQNDPQILAIKDELKNYMRTHDYYQQKLDQYQQRSIQLENYNSQLSKRIELLNSKLRQHKQEIGFRLPIINRSKIKTVKQDNLNKSHHLPEIKHQTEYSLETQSNHSKFDQKKRIIGISQKIQRVKSHQISHQKKTEPKQLKNIQQQQQDKNQYKKKVQQLRQKVTQFNRTQILFHECFQTKKASVQKSVSQLQSKLITNRQQFLNTCQAIGSKQSKVSYEQFKILSSDEIITLFISFVWLNRKLNNQFLKKRKLIMQLMKKLPKIQ